MTEPQFEKLTASQQRVFEQVCVGNDVGHNPRTLDSLEARGYLVSHNQILGGRLPVTIKRYEVPVAVHIRWCAFCAGLSDEQRGASQ